MSATGLASGVGEASQLVFVQGLGEHPLRQLVQGTNRQLVVVGDAAVVSLDSGVLWGKVGATSSLEGVGWV